MKKIIKSFVLLLTFVLTAIALIGCKNNTKQEEAIFDSMPTSHDLYFTKLVSLQTAGLEGYFVPSKDVKFLEDKIARLELKSATDGDTADFHLASAAVDAIPGASAAIKGGTQKRYISVRFLGIDTPESTSAIQPWGKAASAYAKNILENATAIVVDARDTKGNEASTSSRLDSNGTRWLAFIWYTNSTDIDDLSQYRLFQLEMIEQCFSNATGGDAYKSTAFALDPVKMPILYNRYKPDLNVPEDQRKDGTLHLSDVLFEAEDRMQKSSLSSLEKRKFGDRGNDPNYDYSRNPQRISITEAVNNFATLEPKATFIEITGVITAHVGNNFYMQDENTAIYVYMGINGSSIEKNYPRGTTIRVRGRLAIYGGQIQLSGVVASSETFTKVTDPKEMIAMPEPIKLKGNQSAKYLETILGKLVTFENVTFSGKNEKKNGAYTIYTKIKDTDNTSGKFDTINVRINDDRHYPYDEYNAATEQVGSLTGIMGVYSEEDRKETVSFPSYQVVAINRVVEEKDGKTIRKSLISIFEDVIVE